LHIAQVYGTSARDHDFLFGQDETEAGDGLEDFERRQRRVLLKRRAEWI
jgi:hypothetical protein